MKISTWVLILACLIGLGYCAAELVNCPQWFNNGGC